MLGEEYKLSSSSLCSFLHPPVTSSLFVMDIARAIKLVHTILLTKTNKLLCPKLRTLSRQPCGRKVPCVQLDPHYGDFGIHRV
jgi:hypothetical protein